ncbi:TlpA family protein disulfide reductase [Prosthecochloris sp. SCSIO W1101]|uniref:TlpA family protein disulfide reductase n=1 Tax=Prosthecochloris sp. SCSIO W1101 TaxID=2992242 RepID=UPI00223D1FD6|nr:TlpA disulfide reductase family protein [Prosthecochloris sp. SCSIO W1101]UZJ42499.1 TlpA family protein disulfide reductase [Prosthecochloris sp. SCSIO W1101]
MNFFDEVNENILINDDMRMNKLSTAFSGLGISMLLLALMMINPQTSVSGPLISAKALDGTEISSRNLAGKAYIVNFFASWCPPCRQEVPDMVELQETYSKDGFTFIGVGFRDEEQSISDFIWEYGINYPVMIGDQAMISTFGDYIPGGLQAIPVSFVIGRDGSLITVAQGFQNREALEQLILQALETGEEKEAAIQ